MTPDWWRNAHPGECVRAYDVSSGRWRNLPWATPASSNWRSIVGRAVGNVIRHVEERWPHRVLGYHPGLGCCAENAYEWGVSIADYSEAQQLAFDRPLPDPDWKSVVCLANALPSDLIRHFAAEAGVHIYSDHGDQVFAGPGWFALAAKMPGEHTLRPRNGGAAFQVRINRGEFALFEDK